jgi:beta-phosphoglucomutase-like phosphatase (HAD superfamily)
VVNEFDAIIFDCDGVLAARRAGMRVLGFVGGGHCSEDHGNVLLEHGAERLLSCHTELLTRLRGDGA